MAPVPLTTLWGLLGKGNLFVLSRRLSSHLTTTHTSFDRRPALPALLARHVRSRSSGLWGSLDDVPVVSVPSPVPHSLISVSLLSPDGWLWSTAIWD